MVKQKGRYLSYTLFSKLMDSSHMKISSLDRFNMHQPLTESEGWNGLRPELDFHFPRISGDSVSGDEGPIMHRKRSHALRGQETRAERKARRGTWRNPGVKKESERNYGENHERPLASDKNGEERASDKRTRRGITN
ncbi:hypothetical protein TNCV_814131 [Trichonephila clavipes]|nr:hypothetical protein TNCV_814131 [Trichonephila clavipes]